jgi:hypothetical protein
MDDVVIIMYPLVIVRGLGSSRLLPFRPCLTHDAHVLPWRAFPRAGQLQAGFAAMPRDTLQTPHYTFTGRDRLAKITPTRTRGEKPLPSC